MSDTKAESCQHEMEKIGDLVFECSKCHHLEIGCSHGRTASVKTINGATTKLSVVCQICGETLGTIQHTDTTPQADVCQHEFVAINWNDLTCDKIKCTKCGYTTDCQHDTGVYHEWPLLLLSLRLYD